MVKILLDQDAVSDSQIMSKIWLCHHLGELIEHSHTPYPKVWIYGGWCGMLAFMMMVRSMPVSQIRLYDIDPEAIDTANQLMQAWQRNWFFRAEVRDVNMITQFDTDIIINTSTEHMESMDWWNAIPTGMKVVLQNTDQVIDDHYNRCDDLDEFRKKYPLSGVFFEGEKEFVYSNRVFKRFMLIGVK